ncbi:MAG TPA: hypothetical protein VFX30_14090 [bacterium]|nr:hypothetical protein [bacterium]
MKRLLMSVILAATFVVPSASFAGLFSAPPKIQVNEKKPTLNVDPRDIAYAKYLYDDQWLAHLGDIVQKRKENMGNVDPSEVNSIIGLNNFFFFITATNVRMKFHYAALLGPISSAQAADEAMREALKNNDGREAKSNFDMLLSPMSLFYPIVEEARDPVLKAASIYQVRLAAIDPEDNDFQDIHEAFVKGFISRVRSLFLSYGPQINPVTGLDSEIYWDILDLLLGSLIDNASFSYVKSNGEKGYVTFVNFGTGGLHPWGYYGSDGAFDAGAFQFLDF